MAGFWAAAAPIIGSMAGSALSTVLSDKGSSGSGGYDITTMPQYSFTEPRLRLTSDFITENLNRLSRGEYPAYYDKALPQLRESMARPLRETYYGRQGNRTGLINTAMEAGALTGLGGKSALSPLQKVMKEYSDKEAAIDDYLAQLGVSIMSRDAQLFPQMSIAMQAGPQSQTLPYNVPATPGTNYSQLGAVAGDALSQWMSGWGNRQNVQTTPTASYSPLSNAPYMEASVNQPGYYPTNLSQYYTAYGPSINT